MAETLGAFHWSSKAIHPCHLDGTIAEPEICKRFFFLSVPLARVHAPSIAPSMESGLGFELLLNAPDQVTDRVYMYVTGNTM